MRGVKRACEAADSVKPGVNEVSTTCDSGWDLLIHRESLNVSPRCIHGKRCRPLRRLVSIDPTRYRRWY